MDHAALLERYDREMRAERVLVGGERVARPHLVRTLFPAPRMSFIDASDLREVDADAAIAEEVAFFRDRGGPVEWPVFEHDRPADLRERLAAHGFEVEDEETVMALDLEGDPALLRAPGDGVREVGAEALPEVVALLERVYGRPFDWLADRLGEWFTVPGFLRVFVADAEGEPASVGWLQLYPGSAFAALYGGATLPERRGRGLYTALLAVRARTALAAGRRFLVIDAGPMSAPIAAHHGFARLAAVWPCVWRPPEGGA